tara:strand:+ start:274 stop:561 length:288 start_codon:yes stop_codon:yes gene_type:complete
MTIKWILILFIYFQNSDRIDIQHTPYEFTNGVECAQFKSEKEFNNLLVYTFKDKGIAYIRPVCKPTRLDKNDTLVKAAEIRYGSAGICRVAPCIW